MSDLRKKDYFIIENINNIFAANKLKLAMS